MYFPYSIHEVMPACGCALVFLLQLAAQKVRPCTQAITRMLLFMFHCGVSWVRGGGNVYFHVVSDDAIAF